MREKPQAQSRELDCIGNTTGPIRAVDFLRRNCEIMVLPRLHNQMLPRTESKEEMEHVDPAGL
jgi:hypothetical protein